MKTFATKEKQSSPARYKNRPYVHHPMGLVQQTKQAEIRRILRSTCAQAKLSIGQPNGKFEQEADRVADQVMAMPDTKLQHESALEKKQDVLQFKPLADQITPLVQRQEESPEEEEEEPVQAKSKSGKSPLDTPNLEARINSFRGTGQPLASEHRSFFEPRFGYDFSQVRVHTDNQAAETSQTLNARAFTIGRDIVFGIGQFTPNNEVGRRLLAHELAHVVQQRGRRVYIQRTPEEDWERANPDGRVDTLSNGHITWLLWNYRVNSAELKPEHIRTLNVIASRWPMMSLYVDSFSVEGHTSSSGQEATNALLSRNRAEAVDRYLSDRGMPGAWLNWHGADLPRSPNDTPENMARNRRIELRVDRPIRHEEETEPEEQPEGPPAPRGPEVCVVFPTFLCPHSARMYQGRRFGCCDRRGNTLQRDQVLVAHARAIELLDSTASRLSEPRWQSDIRTTWHPYSTAQVQTSLRTLSERLSNASFSYICVSECDTGSGCDVAGDKAYATPGSAGPIFLCWEFFGRGVNNQAVDLAHEAAHNWLNADHGERGDELRNARNYSWQIKQVHRIRG